MLLTDGELDKATGLIPYRAQRWWWCEAIAALGDTSIIPWQSERSGERASSVPRILPPFIIYQGLWCCSWCEWEEIKVLSSNPSLEIPFAWSLKMGRNELLMWKGKTCVSVPQVTWVCSCGKPHQGSSGTEKIISVLSGKVKWVLSSSCWDDNSSVKFHLGDKCHWRRDSNTLTVPLGQPTCKTGSRGRT